MVHCILLSALLVHQTEIVPQINDTENEFFFVQFKVRGGYSPYSFESSYKPSVHHTKEVMWQISLPLHHVSLPVGWIYRHCCWHS